jgi:K+/H+ antiporter YhaU regulatory subunit KhtT
MNQDLQQIGLQISEFNVPAASHFVGHPVSDLAFGSANQFVVVAIRHSDESVTRNPDPSVAMRPGDTLIVLAHGGAVAQLRQRVGKSELVYRGSRA